MVRFLKTTFKIIVIFLFFYTVVAFIENVLDFEVEPYMIYMLFIMVASTVGWTVKKAK